MKVSHWSFSLTIMIRKNDIFNYLLNNKCPIVSEVGANYAKHAFLVVSERNIKALSAVKVKNPTHH